MRPRLGTEHAGRWLDRLLPGGRSRALILLYHRVAAQLVDPWGLAVSPETFAAQMRLLAREWRPIPLAELVIALRSGDVPNRAVAVTFDDGYADNLEAAAAVLAPHDVPATLFAATGFVGSPQETWWDELSALLLEPERLPASLGLRIGADERRLPIPPVGEDDRLPHVNRVRPWLARSGTRLEAYYRVWLELRELPEPERNRLLDEIAGWAGLPRSCRPSHRLLTEGELREFASLAGMAVGCHTVTHPTLSTCSPDAQRRELAAAAEWLRERLGVEVSDVAYPYGDWDAGVAMAVRELGFRSAVAVASRPVWRGSPLYALPRMVVENWSAPELQRRLEAVARQ